MGKDENSFCSLQMKYHLKSNNDCQERGIDSPDIFVSIQDNCVGQNKSNTTMQFDAFMSLSLYKRVTTIYLIPGHSHMIARVVAWVKCALQRKNIYSPVDVVEEMNKVKSVSAELINHNREDRRASFTGWDTFLNKYMNKMPAGFTTNHVIEFVQRTVTMKHLYTSKEEVTVRLAENAESTGSAMWRKIFGTESKEVLVQDICLLVHPIQELKKSKLKSLAKKYSCIPEEYLAYYPQPP